MHGSWCSRGSEGCKFDGTEAQSLARVCLVAPFQIAPFQIKGKDIKNGIECGRAEIGLRKWWYFSFEAARAGYK